MELAVCTSHISPFFWMCQIYPYTVYRQSQWIPPDTISLSLVGWTFGVFKGSRVSNISPFALRSHSHDGRRSQTYQCEDNGISYSEHPCTTFLGLCAQCSFVLRLAEEKIEIRNLEKPIIEAEERSRKRLSIGIPPQRCYQTLYQEVHPI